MKIVKIGDLQTVMSNPESKHDYFGWPTATRLQDGRIAVVASGFRRRHICPFGKTVISYSSDEGKTYTKPAPVIDTVLDDRDGGIVAFGDKNVIVTSFNNKIVFQRKFADAYDNAYLDTITPSEEEKALGVNFRISNDCGVTFGEIHKSPVTSPHGPVELADGTLLWVGRVFNPMDVEEKEDEYVKVYRLNPVDGSMEFVSRLENIDYEGTKTLSCEPHAIVLNDGRILVHIRVQTYYYDTDPKTIFTIFQTESADNGKTWTEPRQILKQQGGAPPHLFRHSSGMLICTYGYRQTPFGIKVMFSSDEGKTWDTDNDLYINLVSDDIGYPSTVELDDGSLLTVFYARTGKDKPCTIEQLKWRFEK